MAFGLASLLGIMVFPAQALAAPSPIVTVPFSPDDDLSNPALRMPAAALSADRLGAPRLQALALDTVDTVARATADKLAALASIDGESALGLLDAYKMFKTGGYLTAARAAGDRLKTYVYPDQKLQAADLVFLNYLTKVTGDDTYKAKGAERLTQLTTPITSGGLGYDTGAKLFNFYNNPTPPAPSELKQDVHWQTAYWAEAGYLYGQTTWANQIITEIIKVQGTPGGFYFDTASKYVRTIGQGKALQVMGQFTAKTYKEQISRGIAYLKSLQVTSSGAVYWGSQDDGVNTVTPWDAFVVQDQALAAIGLAENLASQDVSGIQNAVTYLITSAWYNGAGGFVDPVNGERPGSNSEALQAMFMASKVGDINGDGYVASGDALEVLKYSIGLATPANGSAIAGADRDCSGQYSAGDALVILKNSVGRYNEVVCQ